MLSSEGALLCAASIGRLLSSFLLYQIRFCLIEESCVVVFSLHIGAAPESFSAARGLTKRYITHFDELIRMGEPDLTHQTLAWCGCDVVVQFQ